MIVKSITTFIPSKHQELILVDETHLFLGASTRGTAFSRVAGEWGDFMDMITNAMEVMHIAFPTIFTRAAAQALLDSYLVIKRTT